MLKKHLLTQLFIHSWFENCWIHIFAKSNNAQWDADSFEQNLNTGLTEFIPYDSCLYTMITSINTPVVKQLINCWSLKQIIFLSSCITVKWRKKNPHSRYGDQIISQSFGRVFVAASHQTRLETRSKARRPIKVGIKRRGGRERAETRTLLVSAAHRLT